MNKTTTLNWLHNGIRTTASLLVLCFLSFNSFSQSNCNAQFQFVANPHNPDSIQFTPLYPNSAIATYAWTFGDGTSGTGYNPWHQYSGPGSYWVCLTVSLSNGTSCHHCDSIHVSTAPPPPTCNAHFSFQINSHNTDSVKFMPSQVSTTGTSYLWSFGDGTTSTTPMTWHVYPGPGAYWVCLTVTLSNGNSCNWCDSIHIVVPPPPVCNAQFQFYANPHNPDSVHFYSQSPVSNVTSYAWTFGDGTSGTGQMPWHLYPGPGAYWVCLTVTLSNGTTCNWCDSIHVVTPPPPPPPVCNAHFYFQINPHNPDSVKFGPAQPNTTIATYLWSFGDGTTSTSPLNWHVYPGPGVYWVCLTVTLSNGTSCNWCDSIHISTPPPPPPPPNCNAHFYFYKNPHNPDSIHFIPQTPATTNATYSWTFGDGTTGTGPVPWHLYPGPGAYWVCLTVTMSNGNSCSWCDSIHVVTPPPPVCNAHFQFYTNPHNPDSVHCYPAGPNSSIGTYQWSFGDGTSSTAQSPWHVYPGPGAYWVCLTVTLSNGTSCNWCDSIHVVAPPPPPVCNAQFQTYADPANPHNVHYYPTGPANQIASFLWSFGDGTTSNQIAPWHLYAASGIYYSCLTVTLMNGTSCTWCDSVQGMVVNPNQNPVDQYAPSIRMFPNPVGDNLTLEIQNIDHNVDFEVFDLTGHHVYQTSISGNQVSTVNTTAIEQGVYYYVVRNGSEEISQGRLVIMH